MAVAGDNASGDTAVDPNHKPTVQAHQAPISAREEEEEDPEKLDHNEREQTPTESNGDGDGDDANAAAALERKETGASLDRVPSQAQKLGKKKIFVVMAALCVCLFFITLIWG